MLHAPEALLFGGSDKNTIAHKRGRGIAVKGIETEDDHLELATASRSCSRTKYRGTLIPSCILMDRGTGSTYARSIGQK